MLSCRHMQGGHIDAGAGDHALGTCSFARRRGTEASSTRTRSGGASCSKVPLYSRIVASSSSSGAIWQAAHNRCQATHQAHVLKNKEHVLPDT